MFVRKTLMMKMCERTQLKHTYMYSLRNKIQHAADVNGYGYHIRICICIRTLAQLLYLGCGRIRKWVKINTRTYGILPLEGVLDVLEREEGEPPAGRWSYLPLHLCV